MVPEVACSRCPESDAVVLMPTMHAWAVPWRGHMVRHRWRRACFLMCTMVVTLIPCAAPHVGDGGNTDTLRRATCGRRRARGSVGALIGAIVGDGETPINAK